MKEKKSNMIRLTTEDYNDDFLVLADVQHPKENILRDKKFKLAFCLLNELLVRTSL